MFPRWLAVITFASFLMAPSVKAIPQLAELPFDLTVAGAAATILLVAWRLATRPQVPKAALLPFALFASFLPGVFLLGTTEYASEKVQRLFTLTLLAALAPCVLFREVRDARAVAKAMVVISVGLAAYASWRLVTSPADVVRLSPVDGPITFSRMMGMACVFFSVKWLSKRKPLSLVLLAGSLAAVIGSGSRGVLLSVAVAVFVVFMAFHFRVRALPGVALVLLAAGAGVYLAASFMPEVALARAQGFSPGQAGYGSITTRLSLYASALELAAANPQGIGWGSFDSRVPLHVYPHNILLELAAEAGWLALAAFLAVTTTGLVRAFILAQHHPEARIVFALLVFFLFTAMFSSEVNGHRPLFAFLGLALCIRKPRVMSWDGRKSL